MSDKTEETAAEMLLRRLGPGSYTAQDLERIIANDLGHTTLQHIREVLLATAEEYRLAIDHEGRDG
jgi:hypothetical protein